MKCTICNGLVVPTTMYDQSCISINANRCVMCSNYTYPDFTPLPITPNKKSGRGNIPTMFVYKGDGYDY